MKFFLTALLSAFSLTACVTTAPPAAVAPVAQAEVPPEWPRCPSLESSWGPARGPSLQLNGRQAISYVKPGTPRGRVDIVYEGKTPRFTEIRTFDGKRASDGQMTIMGQRVDFYGSGNEDAEISTQPMQLTSPGGHTGWFSFSFSSKEHLEGKNIPDFTW